MPFNGNGVFTRLYSWANDKAQGIKIRADRMDNEMNGFAQGLSTCITRDGQTTVTADLPMGGYKHTNVEDASNADDYASYKQVQLATVNWAIASGTADAITAAYNPPNSVLANGQIFFVRASAANTIATPTLSIDGLTALGIKKIGNVSLSAGDIAGAGHELILRYVSGSPNRFELLNPAVSGIFTGNVSVSGKLSTPLTSNLVIATDTITVTGTYHTIDTQGSAANDDLVTINGGVDGMELFLRTVNDARDVTVKNTGNISVPGDILLSSSNTIIHLKYDGAKSKWLQVAATNEQGNRADTALQVNSSFFNGTGLGKTGTASIGSTTVPIVYDFEIWDDANWHDNAVNPSRITVNFTGRVLITGGLYGTNSLGNTLLGIFILKNGGQAASNSSTRQVSATIGMTVSREMDCVPGDYFEIAGYCSSGTWNLTVDPQTFFIAKRTK